MSRFELTTDGKKIGKAIDAWATIVSGAIDTGHQLAASVAVHAAIHGDTTLADRLITACDEGFRKNVIKAWLIANGPFIWKKKDGDKPARFGLDDAKRETLAAEVKSEGEAKTLKRLAELPNAWRSKPEKDFQGFDPLILLQRMFKKGKAIEGDSELRREHESKIDLRGLNVIERAIEEIVEQRKAAAN